jgi:uncharacterized protein YciI
MKKWIALLFACYFFTLPVAGQTPANYDKQLADSLGADDYGMKSYMLIILKTGPSNATNKKIIDSLFAGHMQNIGRLATEGKLIVAGPLGKNEQAYRGIFIFDVATKEAAEALLQTDPAIKAGLLAADIYLWYGSAALPMYLPFNDKVEKIKM